MSLYPFTCYSGMYQTLPSQKGLEVLITSSSSDMLKRIPQKTLDEFYDRAPETTAGIKFEE